MTVNQHELARELGITPRRVRQLEDLGVVVAEGRGQYNPETNAARYGTFVRRDERALDRLHDEMLKKSETIEKLVGRLDKRFDLKTWTRAAETVTELDQCWSLSIACRPEAERDLHDALRVAVVAEARERLLHLALSAGAIRDEVADG